MFHRGIDHRPLPSRLAALRRRLRVVVTVRGMSWFLALLLLVAVVAGLIDWRIHLPGAVRAVVLIGALAGAGLIAIRYLFAPLAKRADNFALAMRIEERYPFLNDCLASTVQFLETAARPEPDADTGGSPSLRREAIERTLRQIQVCDFGAVVNARGVGWAGLTLAGGLAVASLLTYLSPVLALTALERLAIPFGAKDWPKQTQLEIQAPARIGRGQPFELHGIVAGVLPDEAVIYYEGASRTRLAYSIRRDRENSRGYFLARLERVEGPFRFQVHANDAVTTWHDVAVEPPPVLVPLEGRPSPVVRLHYPAYTELPDLDLPDGSGNVEAVVGTLVTLRAAADRALARAWIEYRPEQVHVPPAAATCLLCSAQCGSVAALTAIADEVTSPVPAVFDGDRHRFTVTFLPRIRGMYALHLEDATGLSNVRLFDLRLFPDPAPTVNLERPSPTHDSLEVLPDADIAVHVTAADAQFALRSVYLSYRSQKDEPQRAWPLYDDLTTSGVVAELSRGLRGAQALPSELQPKLRPQYLELRQQLTLSAVKHRDGRSLQEGDVITLQARADDFDDVEVDKEPGRSHEIELRIISRATLEAALNQEQTKVQEELLRLRKAQHEALERVIGAEQRWRNAGKLRPQEIDQLLQAEQMQQQIRNRVGTKQEGLRAQVQRILSTLHSNRLPRSGTHDRMETVAAELERLQREELGQIEPRLTNARKEDELATAVKPPPKTAVGHLGEARRHQEEVENTLADLLKQLEPWGNLSAVKGEARSILQEQRGLNRDVQRLDEDTRGKDPGSLTPDEKSLLGRAAELQRKLEERTGQLLDKAKRASEERKVSDPAMAEALREAAQRADEARLQEQMKNAAENIRDNNLGSADRHQRTGIQALESVIQSLEERREQELERLRKKLQQTQDELKEMIGRQQALRKRLQEAMQIPDRGNREQELKRLAREQEKLREESQELLKELTRLRAEQAGQALAEAGSEMDRAVQRLERGQDPNQSQDESLERLNEAQRQIERAQARVEEELAREKLAKIADQLRRLKERQEAAVAEAARIQRQVEQHNQWTRSALINLRNLSEAQNALAQETNGLAEGKLASARVFARILGLAAKAMDQAAQRMLQRAEAPSDTKLDPILRRCQGDAVRRLDQLLDALKSDTGFGKAPSQHRQEQQSDEHPGAGDNVPGDGISYLAQLKALRALQQEVNDHTADFSRKHPHQQNLSMDEQQALRQLQSQQQEIADLLDDLLLPGSRERDKK